ncbi:MAG: alpha/beta hydrolase [Clostridiales bacterium]|nr:alpha/beta hydrolase [Clostridiales bacterium]
MKKSIKTMAVLLSVMAVAQCFCGCGKKTEGATTVSSASSSSEAGQVAGVSQESKSASINNLVNHMTENELSKVTEGPLTVLDEPWNKQKEEDDVLKNYQDGVYFEIWEKEDMLRDIKENPEAYAGWTDEEMEEYKEMFVPYIRGYVVDGRHYGTMISGPLKEEDGIGWYSVLEGDTLTTKEIKDLQELKDKLPAILEEYRKDEYKYFYFGKDIDEEMWAKDIIRIFEAKQDKSYKILPFGISEKIADEKMLNMGNQEEDLSWELDKDAVGAIKDQVVEYTFYDEELDRSFVVHVALPFGYDQTKTYPAIVLTDAVWRFNDTAKLLSEMEAGRAEPQIVISIGQDYSICNSDNVERAAVFCDGKDKFLDFITDNLMPYLGEKYAIDNENSTLFGHSLGGVFTHYALFNSDRYENQPFGKYIIGSPAYWSPYSREMSDYAEQAKDYGYFDRNRTMGKSAFITAGSEEDEDYQEYFQDGDSTTESIAHLAERINAHCSEGQPMAQAKLYKSHHYQYIPEMLVEYADGKTGA